MVTGYTGFLGRNLAAAIQEIGSSELIGVSRSTGVNLEEPQALTNFDDVETIVHLAGRSGVQESWKYPAEFYRTNVLATTSVLEFARQCGARVIMISSYLYGVPRQLPIAEDHPISCPNPYASSKYLAEETCRFYADKLNVEIDVLRPFNIYGAGQDPTSLFGTIVDQALHGTEIIVEDLTPRRDYLFVGDFTSAIIAALNMAGDGWRVFNVGSGVSHDVKEVIDTVLKITQRPLPIKSRGNRRRNEIDECYADTRLFLETCGWRPRYDLLSGLRKVLAAEN